MFIPSSVLSAYMFANTPSYLYKHLTVDPFVRTASADPHSALLALEELQAKPGDATMTDLAHAYALIVALLDASHPVPAWAQAMKWYPELSYMAQPMSDSKTIRLTPTHLPGSGSVPFKVGEAA